MNDSPLDPIPSWKFGPSLEARNALQQDGRVHPFTCGNHECRKATGGILRAVADGWICDHCGYDQALRIAR